ncbi:hypothetical protein Lepto7376_1550 [[Leptolyngbya] sp. PCC 7376]|uniref:hypothetical protein n=1 Tax=[Leptolyngbya] sp. PCC 7376 TaxID=111781 RepID=UPI00029EE5CC|nr:hypothetical protein [[Leptolyngbya] sp. PCC 7376]AFY37892.1 hypothetical protein Lepto7376_1550 [[Leptolyngbya] sp. PCC 7376]
MQNPFFWLLLSFLLVAISLTAVLAAAFPTFLELGRMARSADKLLDTLNRELPRTLESLRKTGGELTGLTDELEDSIKGAKNIIKHTETSIQETQKQIKQVHHNSRSTWAGLKTAWKVLRHPRRKSKRNKRRR